MFLSSRFLSKVAKSSVEALKIKTPKKPLSAFPKSSVQALKIKTPKKPMSVFAKFIQQQYALNLRGDVSSQEFFKTLALKWRTLPVAEKEQYTLACRDEKDKYQAEYETFVKSLTVDEKNHLDLLKKKKKQLKSILKEYKFPTNPSNSFTLFVADNKEAFHSVLAKDGLKTLAAKWSTMSNEEKNVYFQRFEDQKKKYQEEVAKWVKKITRDDNKKALNAYIELKL